MLRSLWKRYLDWERWTVVNEIVFLGTLPYCLYHLYFDVEPYVHMFVEMWHNSLYHSYICRVPLMALGLGTAAYSLYVMALLCYKDWQRLRHPDAEIR